MEGPRTLLSAEGGVSLPLSSCPLLYCRSAVTSSSSCEGTDDFGAFAVLGGIPTQGLTMVEEDKEPIRTHDE